MAFPIGVFWASWVCENWFSEEKSWPLLFRIWFSPPLSLSLLPLLESSKVMRYCGAFSFFSCSVLQVSFVRSQAWLLFLVCLWVCLLIRGWNHGLQFPARQFFLIVSSVPWLILCICPITPSYHEGHYLNNHANLAAILDSGSDACQALQTECCALCCASWFSLEGRYDLQDFSNASVRCLLGVFRGMF